MNIEKRKILLVEDHPIFRLGMSELINDEDDMTVCGYTDTVRQALDLIVDLKPDLVIADISLKQSDGIELVKEINRLFHGLPVLVLSMHDESLYAERAMHAGAKGYIMKQEAMESVVNAVRLVLTGKIYVSEKVKDRLIHNLFEPSIENKSSPMDMLTDRELEVFRYIGQGLSSKEISHRLNLSIKTIGTYRERIKEKLKIKHATELVKCAVHWSQNGQISI
ncbi:Putative Response regulator GacA [Desulfonema limicola]|uniref:Response regulator GacA n=1 Tax=Desulfonema limicola TaxID=45656 RepID=A0A975B7K6_9BACT|nr:response regulator transcription factor [Desulfonema limicola]QTA80326.1 Putative Response regulator GacA [Desulfonema limicola]